MVGNRDVVVDGETGFLVPLEDAEALADRLAQLIEDRELRRRMGRAARAYAEAHFDEQRITEHILEIYDDAIARS